MKINFLKICHNQFKKITKGKPVRFQLRRVFMASVLFAAPTLANAGYTFIDLGTLGGLNSQAFAINNSGQVVGWSNPAGSTAKHATLWNGTTATDLGIKGSPYSRAFAVNNSGQAVGDNYSLGSATLWNGATPTNLYTMYSARSINNTGQIVGQASNHAAIWNGTTTTFLSNLGGNDSSANGINFSGQIVGYSGTADFKANHAVLWDGTTMTDLGTLGGAFSVALAINDLGKIVGWSNPVGSTDIHAALWNGTATIDLGTLGGTTSGARAINNAGAIVGFSTTIGDAAVHATLWHGNVATDLNTLLDATAISTGWVLNQAYGINDSGWIVGDASNSITGQQHAFLLSVATVPEPGTYAMILAGLGLIGFKARRRKEGIA